MVNEETNLRKDFKVVRFGLSVFPQRSSRTGKFLSDTNFSEENTHEAMKMVSIDLPLDNQEPM